MGQGILLSGGTDIDFMIHGVFSYKLFGRSSAYGVILLVLGVALSLITNHLFREDKDLAM